jgi:hypothetical protein
MQDMFNSLSVSNNKANELDFFADEPKSIIKEPEAKLPPKPTGFDFSQQSSGLGSFGTGFGLEGVGQLNSKAFATTSGTGSKGFDLGSLDFSLGTAKQEPANAFSKKPAVQESAYSPMDQVFASQAPQAASVNPATNFTLNQPSNINDFNTMQQMFQTNSNFSNPQGFGQQQQQQLPVAQGQIPAQFVSNQQFQGAPEDFGTSMLRMFQTNTPAQSPPLTQMNLNIGAPEAIPQKQAQSNPLDLFSNNKPVSFATTSGGSFPNNFDMASFGTMQAGSKGGLDASFFEAKPAKASSNSPSTGDLI